MKISSEYRQILRDLAKQVAEIADSSKQKVLKELWCKHNDLHGEKIMVLAYIHDSWPEFFSLQIEEPMLHDWEWRLRHTIYVGNLGTDEVVTKIFRIPYILRNQDFGLPVKISYGSESVLLQGAYTWDPPIKKVEDLKKLILGISVDFETSETNFNIAQDLFGDILDVQLDIGVDTSIGDKLAMLRGIDKMMLDVYDNPEFLHELMAFLREETIKLLKHTESHNLFKLLQFHNWSFTSELPKQGFDGEHVRLCDLQACGSAQAWLGVSPDIFEEFVFQPQKPLLELFGQIFYGCCEPLHDKLDIIMQLKNLARVSISPWADLKMSAEKLQDKYILSWKPHPGIMASDKFDTDEIKKGLKEAVEITGGCHLEIIMKDVTTTKNHPERLKTWVDIAQKIVKDIK